MACMYTVLVSAFTVHCVQQYKKYGYATAAVSVLSSLCSLLFCVEMALHVSWLSPFTSISNHSFQFSRWLNSNGVTIIGNVKSS